MRMVPRGSILSRRPDILETSFRSNRTLSDARNSVHVHLLPLSQSVSMDRRAHCKIRSDLDIQLDCVAPTSPNPRAGEGPTKEYPILEDEAVRIDRIRSDGIIVHTSDPRRSQGHVLVTGIDAQRVRPICQPAAEILPGAPACSPAPHSAVVACEIVYGSIVARRSEDRTIRQVSYVCAVNCQRVLCGRT